jgi:hypothetical protein
MTHAYKGYGEVEQKGWCYRNFKCGHHLTGQILSEKTKYGRKKHFRFCDKCGKKFYVD